MENKHMTTETPKSNADTLRDAIEARFLEQSGGSEKQQEKTKSWLSDHLIVIGPGDAS
tara:strand:+ start:58 stop:231 length:174 start_codon:yes stop_codon:yes gene_type:complete